MTSRTIGTRDEWRAASAELLQREKDHTRLGDELAAQRRALPWVPVEQDYVLQTEDGPKTLAELFDGRSQLLIYHFMFGASYELGCPVNSSMADGFDGLVPHLAARDVTFINVSGAPIEKLRSYRKRMGWHFTWASSYGSSFERDLAFSSDVDEMRAWLATNADKMPPVARRNAEASGTDLAGYISEGFGFTAFVLEDGVVYQTYAITGRGVEFLMGYYGVLDRAPKGRDESRDDWQLWIRRRDEYGLDQAAAGTSATS